MIFGMMFLLFAPAHLRQRRLASARIPRTIRCARDGPDGPSPEWGWGRYVVNPPGQPWNPDMVADHQ